jgi:outer membrane protein OmpA-like peptidoglycan-associated protein
MKKIVLTGILLSMIWMMQAQEKGLHLTASFNTGLANLRYTLNNNVSSRSLFPMGAGGTVGAQFFFTEHWGISLGVGMELYRGKAEYNNSWKIDPEHYQFQNMTDGDVFNGEKPCEVRIALSNWLETQKAWLIEIPIMANYQKKWGAREIFGAYFNAGFKIQIPLQKMSSFEVAGNELNQISTLNVEAYWADHDLPIGYPYGIPTRGLGTSVQPGYSDALKLKINLAFAAETGFLIRLSRRLDLTLGAYFDLGLLNMKKENALENGNLIMPNSTSLQETDRVGGNLLYAGLLQSHATNKVNTIAAGMKIGLKVKLGKLKELDDKDELKKTAQKGKTEVIIVRDSVVVLPIAIPLGDGAGGFYYPDSLANETMKNGNAIPGWQNIQNYGSAAAGQDPDSRARAQTLKNMPSRDIDLLLDPVYFDLDKSILPDSAKVMLAEKARILKKYPALVLTIVGHTCDIATDSYNEKLGMRRAQAVKNYLLKCGVRGNRLDIVSEGKQDPDTPNTSENNRKKNRKVYFILAQ